MQVSIDKVSDIRRKINIVVPSSDVQSAMDKQYQQLQKTARLPGFRPGKAPRARLEQLYGHQVEHEVLSKVMQKEYMEAIEKEDLNVCGHLSFDPEHYEKDQPFSFTAECEVFPEVKLQDLSSVKLDIPEAAIQPADVDEMIERVKKQHQNWVAVDRPAAKGDRVKMDFEGTKDGEAFAGGASQDATLELGSGQFIPGFEDGLVGAKAGDHRDLSLSFPEDYHNKDLAGQAVQFAVDVKAVEAVELPTIDQLVETLSIEPATEEGLRDRLKTHMERELRQALKHAVKEQAMDALLEAHQFEVPESLVHREQHELQKQMKARFAQQFGRSDVPDLPSSYFKDDAERRVKLGLLVNEIIKQEKLEADEASIDQTIHDLTEAYEDTEQMARWYRSQKDRMAQVESMVLEQKVVDWVREKAQSKTLDLSYYDALEWRKDKPQSTESEES